MISASERARILASERTRKRRQIAKAMRRMARGRTDRSESLRGTVSERVILETLRFA